MATKLLWFILSILFLPACADNTPVSGPYPKYGLASWYSASITASGEKFNENDLTCAIRKKEFGKHFKVCNVANNECVVVRQNDFGPAKHFYEKRRIIDLSKAAFSHIADLEEGVVEVTVEEQ